MRNHSGRIAIAVATFVAAALLGTQVRAQQLVNLNLPAQPLADALRELGFASNTNIIFDPSLVKGITAPPLNGPATAEQLLARLLTGTQLRYKFVDERTVSLMPAAGRPAGKVTDQRTSALDSADRHGATEHALRLARGGSGTESTQRTASANSSAEQQDAESSAGDATTRVQEIIVTAQKRSERLQDVPVPVTAIDGDSLLKQNQLRIQDYYASIPGLNLVPGGFGESALSIRGLTTGAFNGNPTVGITIDDVSFGSTSTYGALASTPELDPSELERVEVLRGPQGTLYGVSSIGGLLKFVTKDPSTEGFSGRVQAGMSSVRNGSDPGYNVRAAVNVPLGDTLAIRATGFTRRDPGYIDDPVLDVDGLNYYDVYGGRLSALWRPSAALSLKLSAMLQDTKGHGSAYAYLLPGLGDLQQSSLRDSGKSHKRLQLYSAILNAQVGAASLTSVSGYGINEIGGIYDSTYFWGALAGGYFGETAATGPDRSKTKKFMQEVRLSVPVGSQLEWLLGAFYTHEDTFRAQQIFGANAVTGAAVGMYLDAFWPTTYAEYAAFSDLTIHFTDRFDVQVGARGSENKQTYSEVDAGPWTDLVGQPSPLINPRVNTKDSAVTYLLTPRLKISPDLMAYGRLASGYRAGGPNPTCLVFTAPCHFSPDKTRNYEVGLKGDFLSGALSIDGSVYYIDWKGIQLGVLDPVSNSFYFANASRARSQGVELSFESRPTRGLKLAAWGAWNDAELTEGFPPTSASYGVSGDRLPNSSRFSGHVSIEQEWPLSANMTGLLGASLSYVGKRTGTFQSSPLRQSYPSYTQTNVNAELRYGSSWTIDAFITNLTDERGILLGGRDAAVPYGFIYIQPRTLGVSLSRSF